MAETPGSDKYVGKCTGCGKRYTWPKGEGIKGLIGPTAGEMDCPSCGAPMRQTNRNGSAPFHEIYEHQARNMQLFNDRRHFAEARQQKHEARKSATPQGGEPGLTSL